MIYSKTITTPANTSKENALRSALKVSKGLVYRVEIDFPTGPSGLLHVTILDGNYQAWPSSPDDTFNTNGVVIGFDDTYLKLQDPAHFTVVTYNLDDTFEHSVQVRIGLVSKEIFMARFLPSITYDKMLELLRKAEAEQQAYRESIIQKPFTWKG